MRTPKIVAVLCSSLFLYIVGVVLAVQSLFFMAAAVLGTVLASYLFSRLSLSALRLECSAALAGHEDTTVTLPLTVVNEGRLPRFLVTLELRLPAGLTCLSEQGELFIPLIPAAGRSDLVATMHLEKRGAYRLTDVRVSAVDPLGMFGSSRPLPAPAEILVYPQIVPLLNPALSGRSDPRSAETSHRELTPGGEEFHGVRQYVPGDGLRRVHWKSTARHGQFHVIEFAQPVSRSVSLILDTSAGTDAGRGRETTFEYACRLAASLLWHCHQHGGRGDLFLPSTNGGPAAAVVSQSSGATGDWFRAALCALARAVPSTTEPFDAVVLEAVANADPRGQYLLLSSSLSTRLPQATRLLANRLDSLTVVLFDALSFAPQSKAPSVAKVSEDLLPLGVTFVSCRKGQDLSQCLTEETQ
jgi:uncharacterized protein (DUF58 family)